MDLFLRGRKRKRQGSPRWKRSQFSRDEQFGIACSSRFLPFQPRAVIKFLENPDFFDSYLKDDILKAVTDLERKTDKSFSGESSNLLLVSVRSGAKFSMPGMMDTILNLGLNDHRTRILAEQTNPDFAYNCYRRLLQMFADVVYGIF